MPPADKVYYANTTDKDAVLDIARSERVAAVTTTGTDVAVSSIGYVCRELGLCGISEQAARVLTDKALMKEAFVNGGVTTAEFRRVESYEEAVAAAEELGLPGHAQDRRQIRQQRDNQNNRSLPYA